MPSRQPRPRLHTVPFLALALVALPPNPSRAGEEVLFSRDVAPILEKRCLPCHNDRAKKGGLSLASAAGARAGGRSGPALVPGKPDASLLVRMISGAQPAMPRSGGPLLPEQVARIRAWVERGASWPPGATLKDDRFAGQTWWSLRDLAAPTPPAVKRAGWVRTPVDAFVLHRLEEAGLGPSPEADRRTLLRRLYHDLLGLPATPEEIDAFAHDPAPDAYEKRVEQLLASPHYGERWTRHWLDVVHYGDTHGYDKDKLRPHAWPYRDYLIHAFNEDRPYRRFIEEQLAGDVLYPQSRDGITALGFLAAGPWDFVGHAELREGTLDKQITRNLDRDDMVATTLNTFASLTVQCARCHDHKFDPISQEEYYSLQAVFAAVDRADRPYDADPRIEAQRTALQERLARGQARNQALGNLSAGLALGSPPRAAAAALGRELRDTAARLVALPPPHLVYAAATHFAPVGSFTPTNGRPRPIRLLYRGNEKTPRQEVGPGTVRCLPGLEARFGTGPDEGQRRAALARWLTDPRNPLTWRSLANRVWQYHFGPGLVDTPNDFGRMGSTPSHPELLDYLAVRFRDGGQSVKDLHRLIVQSATYRQSSAHRDDGARIDGGNRLLWRMNRRRLEAEAVRDAVLAVSGRLDRRLYGPGFRPFGFVDDHSPHYQYEDYDPDAPGTQRRSVYRFLVRSVPDPFMETLDCADPSLRVEKRNETLTPLQALALLNDRFMVRMAGHFAARLQQEGGDLPAQIARAYRLALGRAPTAAELALLAPFARDHGLANACRLLLNTNEFAFID